MVVSIMDSPQTAGGLARAAILSPERRSEIASEAAQVRWSCKHTPPTHVYVASDGEHYKIGRSCHADFRMKKVSRDRGKPVTLILAVAAPNSEMVEKTAHWILKDRHVGHEWFAVSELEARNAVYQACTDVQDGNGKRFCITPPPGRPRLTTIPVKLSFTYDEMAVIDAQRGDQTRAEWIKETVLNIAKTPRKST